MENNNLEIIICVFVISITWHLGKKLVDWIFK